jgi:spore maturation protein CgeB
MRLLVVHPGASYSTHDVFVGLYNALQTQGHDLHVYQLDTRIERVASWLRYCWRKAGKPLPAPSPADIIYRASYEALERALRFDVDGVLIISAMYVHPDVLLLLKRAGLPTGIVFTESPYDDGPQYRVAEMVDACWTNERTSLRVLKLANPHTYYLPHAYNDAAYGAADLDEEVPAHDVVFVGTGFPERVEMLRAVDWSGIDLGLYGQWHMLGSRSKLREFVRGNVIDNRLALELYRRAKIGLNLYRRSRGFGRGTPRIGQADSLNPRAYDLAAARCFQISDYRAEVEEIFGSSVPTFSGPRELETMLRFYLDNPQARADHADEAHDRVGPHTYAERARQLVGELQRSWTTPLAKGA